MRVVMILIGMLIGIPSSYATGTCPDGRDGLGVSRVVEIDTSNGPLYGDMTKYVREESFLGPKEVVLTFDDGPMPRITKSILDTLDRFCTKATFFSVGRMAMAYPATVKEIVARGHTLGTHTWSHPLNLKRLSLKRAKDQIDRGFAAVSLAAGQDIAPFFRFPGLSDSNPLLAHLQSLGVASFTVDVVSNDSFISSSRRVADRTVRLTVARQGGILLFHDIKRSAAKALPSILARLKAKGYKVVHIKPKSTMARVISYDNVLKPMLAKKLRKKKGGSTSGSDASRDVVAAQEAAGSAGQPGPPVTRLAPAARPRVSAARPAQEGGQRAKTSVRKTASRKPARVYRRKKKPQEPDLFDFDFGF